MKSSKKGEIATLLTIAVLFVVGATALISSLVLKKNNTLQTKADEGYSNCVSQNKCDLLISNGTCVPGSCTQCYTYTANVYQCKLITTGSPSPTASPTSSQEGGGLCNKNYYWSNYKPDDKCCSSAGVYAWGPSSNCYILNGKSYGSYCGNKKINSQAPCCWEKPMSNRWCCDSNIINEMSLTYYNQMMAKAGPYGFVCGITPKTESKPTPTVTPTPPASTCMKLQCKSPSGYCAEGGNNLSLYYKTINNNINWYKNNCTEFLTQYIVNSNNDTYISILGDYCGCTGSENITLNPTPPPANTPTPPPANTPTPSPANTPIPTVITTQAVNNTPIPTLIVNPTLDPNSTSQEVCSYNNIRYGCSNNIGGSLNNSLKNIPCISSNGWAGSVTESVVCDKPINQLLPCLFYYKKSNIWKKMEKQTQANDNICDLTKDQIMTVKLIINNDANIKIKSKIICFHHGKALIREICNNVSENDIVTFTTDKTYRLELIKAVVMDNNDKTFTAQTNFQRFFCYNLGVFCNDLKDIKNYHELTVTIK